MASGRRRTKMEQDCRKAAVVLMIVDDDHPQVRYSSVVVVVVSQRKEKKRSLNGCGPPSACRHFLENPASCPCGCEQSAAGTRIHN